MRMLREAGLWRRQAHLPLGLVQGAGQHARLNRQVRDLEAYHTVAVRPTAFSRPSSSMMR